MNVFKSAITAGMIVVTAMLTSSVATAQFEDSAKWIPESANTIVMVQTKEILDSETSKEEKWKRTNTPFGNGSPFGLRHTRRSLLSAQMDFEFMEPIWTVCVFEKYGSPIDIIEVSKAIGGNLDELNGEKAIILPNDTFVVPLNSTSIGSYYPANRQMASKWLRAKQNATMNLSSYLTQAVEFADQNADIILAIDLEGIAHPKLIRDQLSSVCKGDDMDAFCEAVCSVQGATLGVTINDKVTGSIKVDFSGDISSFAANAKELILEVLSQNGVMIDDIRSWKTETTSKQVRLTGSMTTDSLNKIGSFVHHPISNSHHQSDSSVDTVDTKTASLQYFHDVQEIISTLGSKDASALTTYANWYRRYARRIDQLAVVGVDPELLAYGGFVADSFRQATGILREANYNRIAKRSGYAELDDVAEGYRRYEGYGYGMTHYDLASVENRKHQILGLSDAQEKAKGFSDASQIVRDIESETAKIRKSMSVKYETEF